MLRSPWASNFSWLYALTLTGTSCRRSSRRCAVTTISCNPLAEDSVTPVAWHHEVPDHTESPRILIAIRGQCRHTCAPFIGTLPSHSVILFRPPHRVDLVLKLIK